MFHQAGVCDTLNFVISWFMSSMVKPAAFSLLRLFIPSTACCKVHRGAKMSLKISYTLSASVLDLRKMTEIWNSCWCNPLTKDPTLHLKGCFAALHLKTCIAHASAFSFYWHQYPSSPLNLPCWRGAWFMWWWEEAHRQAGWCTVFNFCLSRRG